MASKTAKAYIKGVDSQPRKVSIVASLVRDRYVDDAVVILNHTPRRAATAVKKAIESAKANLLQSTSVDTKTISISRISVTAGSRMRRYVPASRGRALPFEKISSNIFVEVSGEEKVKKAAKPETAKEEPKKAEPSKPAKKADKIESKEK
jgi:large subunit ribosomal protein L22